MAAAIKKQKKPASQPKKNTGKAPSTSAKATKPQPVAAPKPAKQVVPSVAKDIKPKPVSDALSPRLQHLVDKDDISRQIYDFCRGLDRLDETLLRSVSHSDATIDLGPGVFQGLFSDYIPWVLDVLAQTRISQNFIGNMRIDIEGDAALVESYVQTYFRLEKPTGREDLFIGGRFLDRFEKRPQGSAGVWKLAHRKHMLDWTRTEAVSEVFYHQNPDALWSNRSKKDPSLQMDLFPGAQNGTKSFSFLNRRFDTKSIKL